jgi:hypothetical protein
MNDLDLSQYPYIDTTAGLLERIAKDNPAHLPYAEGVVARLTANYGEEVALRKAPRYLADMVLTREQKISLFTSHHRMTVPQMPDFAIQSISAVTHRPDVTGWDDAMQVTGDYLRCLPQMKASGFGLVLCGGAGLGKTLLGSLILEEARRQSKRCCYTTADKYYTDCRPHSDSEDQTTAEKNIRIASQSDFLLLDELFATLPTSFTTEKLELLMAYRYNYKLPTIITSNISWNAIAEGLSAPMVDRLLERNRVLELDGPSYRGRGAGPTKNLENLARKAKVRDNK